MPNIAQVLKEEIARLARKELRAHIGPVQARVSELRKTIVAQKRQIAEMEKVVGNLKDQVGDKDLISAEDVSTKEVENSRITAKRIAALRKKLGLSRNAMGALLGVNANSIYLWENDKTTPRKEAKAKLIQLRSMGKREINKLLDEALAGEAAASPAPVKKAPAKKAPARKKKAPAKKTAAKKAPAKRKTKAAKTTAKA